MVVRGALFVLLLTECVFPVALGEHPAEDPAERTELPILDEVSGPGTGWVGYKLRLTNATDLQILMGATHLAGGPLVVGVGVYDFADRHLGSLVIPVSDGLRTGSVVGVDVAGVSIAGGEIRPLGSRPQFFLFASAEGTREFKLLLWVAAPGGENAQYTYRLRGGTGVELLWRSAGAGTILHQSDAFQGEIAVSAYVVSSGAHAVLGGQRAFDVTMAFHGAFCYLDQFLLPGCRPPPPTSVETLSADTPSGSTACPCEFGELGAEATGPGRYVFHLQGAGVDYGTAGRSLYLVGVDAYLPA